MLAIFLTAWGSATGLELLDKLGRFSLRLRDGPWPSAIRWAGYSSSVELTIEISTACQDDLLSSLSVRRRLRGGATVRPLSIAKVFGGPSGPLTSRWLVSTMLCLRLGLCTPSVISRLRPADLAAGLLSGSHDHHPPRSGSRPMGASTGSMAYRRTGRRMSSTCIPVAFAVCYHLRYLYHHRLGARPS